MEPPVQIPFTQLPVLIILVGQTDAEIDSVIGVLTGIKDNVLVVALKLLIAGQQMVP